MKTNLLLVIFLSTFSTFALASQPQYLPGYATGSQLPAESGLEPCFDVCQSAESDAIHSAELKCETKHKILSSSARKSCNSTLQMEEQCTAIVMISYECK